MPAKRGQNGTELGRINFISRSAEKSLAFPVCSRTIRIFLGWAKEVTTTKS
jgi:hypothetical protein